MFKSRVRERERVEEKPARAFPLAPLARPKRKPLTEPIRRPETRRQIQKTQERLVEKSDNQRFQTEFKQMQQEHDLDEVDDDVEDVATLLEWRALEHNHQPKSAMWYAVYAVSITAITVGFILFSNIIAGVTIALVGALVYYVVQQEPQVMRYRIMTEGIAFNNLLYHYRDLDAFNIVYEPGVTKTMLIRSKKPFAPLLHMEIGDADPIAIRDLMLEFVKEDQELDEPITDLLARRLGF